MTQQPEQELKRAVADAVECVNATGGACVHLSFAPGDEMDFFANSATFDGNAFEFAAGFETCGGSVSELMGIRVEQPVS